MTYKYKAIFLDFYGTVVHEDDQTISEICQKVKQMAKVDCTEKDIMTHWWKQFATAFQASYGESFQLQRDIELQSLLITVAHYQADLDAVELCQKMFSFWEKPDIFPDSISFLQDIDIPVYILSNIDRQDIDSAIQYHQLPVADVITSEDVRSYKPRSEMFQHALTKYQLEPNQVIHIGDSLTSDIQGAQASNIPTIWLNRRGRALPEHIQPDHICADFKEVKKVISN